MPPKSSDPKKNPGPKKNQTITNFFPPSAPLPGNPNSKSHYRPQWIRSSENLPSLSKKQVIASLSGTGVQLPVAARHDLKPSDNSQQIRTRIISSPSLDILSPSKASPRAQRLALRLSPAGRSSPSTPERRSKQGVVYNKQKASNMQGPVDNPPSSPYEELLSPMSVPAVSPSPPTPCSDGVAFPQDISILDLTVEKDGITIPPLKRRRITPPLGSDTSSISSLSSSRYRSRKTSQTGDPPEDCEPQAVQGATVPSFLSTQSHTSKRVTISGYHAVRGSDEDTDDSLEDLDALLARPKVTNTASTSRLSVSKRGPSKNTIYIQPKGKLNLSEMQEAVKTAQARREKATAAAEMESNSKAVQEKDPLEETSRLEITEELLASCLDNVNHDETDFKRTMNALNRIEAFQYETVWHFFEQDQSPKREQLVFPRGCLPAKRWAELLQSSGSRNATFKSGIIARIASAEQVPHALTRWLLQEIIFESEEDLVFSYLEILEAARKFDDDILPPALLRQLFENLGGRSEAANLLPVIPTHESLMVPIREIPPNVKSVVRLIQRLSPSLQNTSELAIQILIRLAIDNAVLRDSDLQFLIEDTIAQLVQSLPEESFQATLQKISCEMFNSVKNDVLRYRIIKALPAIPGRVHHFRRHLAYAFALDKSSSLGQDLDNKAFFGHILLFLERSSKFRFNRDPDYQSIIAIINMLDIAIDAGFSPPTPANSESSGSKKDSHSRFLSRIQSRSPLVDDETADFYCSVNLLIDAFGALKAKLGTHGASHISKLEAKSTIDRVNKRLKIFVQIKDPKRKGSDYLGRQTDFGADQQLLKDYMSSTRKS